MHTVRLSEFVDILVEVMERSFLDNNVRIPIGVPGGIPKGLPGHLVFKVLVLLCKDSTAHKSDICCGSDACNLLLYVCGMGAKNIDFNLL